MKQLLIINLTILAFVLTLISINSYSQNNDYLPAKYDSIQLIKSGNNLFLYQEKEVLNISYGRGGNVNANGFYHVPADSCYTFLTDNSYDFYFFNKDTVTNRKYTKNSSIAYYTKYFANSKDTIESGKYYIIRDRGSNVVQSKDYKIGIWKFYQDGQVAKTIDYDNYEINGQKIVFNTPKSKCLNDIKSLTDSIMLNTFGRYFYDKYIKFNLGLSRYDSHYGQHNDHNFLLSHTDQNIIGAEMQYDIVINDTLRFNAAYIRTYKQTFKSAIDLIKSNNLRARGLDTTLIKFNPMALNFKLIAKQLDFDISSKDFYLSIVQKPEDQCYSKLYFKMMQFKEENDPNKTINGRKCKGYYHSILIDPVSGVITRLPLKVITGVY